MPNLPEVSNFDPVYELQRTDSVDAGFNGAGVSNEQAQNLTNRTKWLKDQLAAITAGTYTGATQPIFNNTTAFATTAFVQENKGSYVNSVRINASVNPLEIGSLGWLLIANGLFISDNLTNNNQTITLQSLAAIPIGTPVHFKNEDPTYSVAIAAAVGELFVSPSNLDSGNVGQGTIILNPGCDITIVRSAQNSILGTGTPHWHIIVHQGNLRQWVTVGSGGSAPAFQNSWTGQGGIDIKFRRNGKYIELLGQVSGGGWGTVVYTLPSGYRPIISKYVPITALTASSAAGPAYALIGVGGDITVLGSGTVECSLDGIILPLD